jgi:signal transduction histidine kinase
MKQETAPKTWIRRRSFFGKFVVSFVTLIVFVVAVNGAFEAWFAYRDTTEQVAKSQAGNAKAAAGRIEQFISEIERQISWATRASSTTIEQRRTDYALLLQQVPAIDRLIYLDGEGREQLRLTRGESAVTGGADYSDDPRFKETRTKPVWLSPIYFDGPDPFMAIAMAHSGRNAGSTVAEVNLKFVSPLIDRSRIGEDVDALVVGPRGRLIAHSDPEVRLGTELAELPQVAGMMKSEPVNFGKDTNGRSVLTAGASIPRTNWYVFFEQPLNQALAPVYGLLYRTAWLLAGGILLAVLAGILLARQLVTPIRALQVGAQQLEASDFGHRIDVHSGDEIEELARQFNRMADQLQGSYSRLEQKVAERTKDLAQSISELKALEEIGRAVASSLDPEAVLATIVTRAVEFSHADAGEIFSYDASRDVFELAETHGLDPSFQDKIRAIPITLGESVLGLSAKQQKAVSFPDLSSAPANPLKDLTLSAGFNSVLVVPLLGQDVIVGALVLQRRAVGDFPERTIGLMQTFAHQSVLALNNAQQFREVDQKGRGLAIASAHKSQFIANMNHELRTPLNAVLGYSELLADGLYGKMPAKALQVLSRIQANGKHLLGLINDVLDISKMEAGQLSLSLDDYSVESVVQSVVSATGSLAEAKGIQIKTSVAEGLPLGRGDERRLTQVLLNLVSNAIKFTDSGSVEVGVDAVNGEFNIMVRDTGPGIAPADQARIFEEFQQVDDSSTRKKGGTGLGLSISRRLIDMHGGRIGLDSTLGKGSTFSIILPIRVNDQESRASA